MAAANHALFITGARRSELILSPQSLEEPWRVPHYSKIRIRFGKLGISMETAEQALRRLVEISHNVQGKEHFDIIADDPSDNAFLACAIEGNADLIMAGVLRLVARLWISTQIHVESMLTRLRAS